MADDEKRTFLDIQDGLMYGGPLASDEDEEDNHDEDPAESGAPDEDTLPDDEDNLDEEPAESEDEDVEPEDDESGEDEEPSPEEEDEPEGEGEADGEADEDTSDDELTVEVTNPDGSTEEVTLDELRAGYMRQADYSRKTAEVSEMREQIEAAWDDRTGLAQDIAESDAMRDFLGENPEAIAYLMEDPEATRELIRQGPEEIQAFAEDYRILMDNPRLAERLDKDDPEEVSEEIQTQRRNQAVGVVVNSMDNAIETIGEEFPEVDTEGVAEYVMDLVDLPYDVEEPDPDQVFAGVERLYKMFFVNDGEEVGIDPRLIRKEFERRQRMATRDARAEEEEAEEHNREVDQQLEDDDDDITSTPEGDAPGQEPERIERPKSYREALDRITGLG